MDQTHVSWNPEYSVRPTRSVEQLRALTFLLSGRREGRGCQEIQRWSTRHDHQTAERSSIPTDSLELSFRVAPCSSCKRSNKGGWVIMQCSEKKEISPVPHEKFPEQPNAQYPRALDRLLAPTVHWCTHQAVHEQKDTSHYSHISLKCERFIKENGRWTR